MMGPMQAIYKGQRLFAIAIVGALVAFVFGPMSLGAITGAVGVELGMKPVAVICGFAALYVMGWLS